MPQKVNYSITGNCKKCGECCRRMYSFDTYEEDDFKLMKKFFPKYKRFNIVDKDEQGNFIFACNLIGKDGLCTDYKNRLKMCRKYPHYKVKWGVQLPDYCGFKINPEKTFDEFLK
ncbi:MAG: YkgJ family cysteine cluster protein [bacterium]